MASKKKAMKSVVAEVSGDFSEIVASLKVLTNDAAMSKPIEEMSILDQANSYVLLKRVEKLVKARLESLNSPLVAVADKNGKLNDEGTVRTYEVGGNRVTCEHRKSKTPDPDKVMELLKPLGLDEKVFDVIETKQMNMSKLESLVSFGKVDQAKLDSFKSESKALRVYAAKHLEEAMSDASEAIEG